MVNGGDKMEEEKNNIDNENNNVNDDKSSMSPLRNSAKNVINNFKDNKYASRKNQHSSFNNKENIRPSRNNATSGGLGGIVANRAFNRVARSHPSLRAANTIKNVVSNRRRALPSESLVPNSVNTSGNARSNSNGNINLDDSSDNDINVSSDGSGTSNTIERNGRSLNPLRSILGGETGLSGTFSFWGRIPLAVKIGAVALIGFIALFVILFLPMIIYSEFSGLLGVENGAGSSGSNDNAYSDYEFSSDGDQILHESLSSFLESHGSSLTEFNNLISNNVENSGYGTRAGVVAAAVTLIAELGNNYNVKIPYYWGGGHGRMIEGADGNWGSSSCHTYANGQSYNYCGLDCSGFVAWAIYNGGFNVAARSAGTFQNLPGAERVTLSSGSAVLQPGDLMESNSHVVLVVDVIDGGYVVAEAAGNSTGVKFSTKRFGANGYWGVNMDGFYEQQVRS